MTLAVIVHINIHTLIWQLYFKAAFVLTKIRQWGSGAVKVKWQSDYLAFSRPQVQPWVPKEKKKKKVQLVY